jgi:tRNA-splicing ligase RtcB
MDRNRLRRVSPDEWLIDPAGPMRVGAVIFADEALIDAIDDKVAEQISNVGEPARDC